MTELAFTFAEGDVVRLDGKPHRVIRIHLDGTTTLVGERGLRTVDSFRLTPARKGDRVTTASAPAPPRKRGVR